MGSSAARFIVAVNLLAAVLILGIGWKVLGVGHKIDALIELTTTTLQKVNTMATLKLEWDHVDAGGKERHVVVSVTQQTGETEARFHERFEAEVDYMEAQYPPNV